MPINIKQTIAFTASKYLFFRRSLEGYPKWNLRTAKEQSAKKVKTDYGEREFLKGEMAELLNEKIDIFDYVKAVSFKFLPKS